DGINTLTKYRQLGDCPKERLVQQFLQEVIKDCGKENKAIAQLILFLLTDDDDTRPLKTRPELAEELTFLGVTFTEQRLDLVLDILAGSGIVLEIPETPLDLYQLVHDYLVSYIRERYVASRSRNKPTHSPSHSSSLPPTPADLSMRQRVEQAQQELARLQATLNSDTLDPQTIHHIAKALGQLAALLSPPPPGRHHPGENPDSGPRTFP
ncbi:MAG TPA: hypothetical protein V6C88_14845, partial [Chroococcidiopsis sp.]